MTESPPRRVPWIRIFLEGAVIVGSILLALALDAWWAERVERSMEREELARLYTEMAENRTRIDVGPDALVCRVARASYGFFDVLADRVGQAEAITVSDTLLLNLLHTPTFDPITPALDGLVQSGRLEMIRSLAVRNAISSWHRWLAQLSETETPARTFTQAQLVPALIARADVAHVLLGAAAFVPFEGDSAGATAVRIDTRLKALVAVRAAQTRSILEARSLLTAATDSLLVAISAAQADDTRIVPKVVTPVGLAERCLTRRVKLSGR